LLLLLLAKNKNTLSAADINALKNPADSDSADADSPINCWFKEWRRE